MRLFNSKTQRIEPFQPLGDEVMLSVCGPEPEETTQLGQVFFYCVADILARYLVMKGWPVRHTQGTVETSDNQIEEAVEGADDWRSKQIQRVQDLFAILQSLNLRPPDNLSWPIDEGAPASSYRQDQPVDIYLYNLEARPDSDDGSETGDGSSDSRASSARFKLQVATVNGAEQDDSIEDPVAVDDLLQRFSADAVRIYLARHHYRAAWTHDEVALQKASQHAERLDAAMQAVSTGDRPINIRPIQNRFTAAMDNDLDTVKGLATLLNIADEILFRAPNGYSIDGAQVALQKMAAVFGLRLNREMAEESVVDGWNEFRKKAA